MISSFLRSMPWVVAVVVASSPAWAGTGGTTQPPTFSKDSQRKNQAFAGIQWNFNVRNGATAVLGFRSVTVDSDNKVRGATTDITFPLTGAPFGVGEVHLKGVAGNRDGQGELGVGYSFAGAAFLLNAAYQGPYVYVGTDYLFGPGFMPYVGINTIGKYNTVPAVANCPAGFTLQGGVCVSGGPSPTPLED